MGQYYSPMRLSQIGGHVSMESNTDPFPSACMECQLFVRGHRSYHYRINNEAVNWIWVPSVVSI